MTEEYLEIKTPDGDIDSILYGRDLQKERPLILHLTDIKGIRPAKREMAKRLANEGFSVLLVNSFYRSGKEPLFESPFDMKDEKTKKRFGELTIPLTPDAVNSDAEYLIKYIKKNVTKGPLGIIGFCFSGALALRYAAACPEDISAAVSFHGGRLYTDQPDSPHHLLGKIKASLYFGFAVEDSSMPVESVEKLIKHLKEWGGNFKEETYKGGRHGWTVSDSAVYNKEQAERAFYEMVSFFKKNIANK